MASVNAQEGHKPTKAPLMPQGDYTPPTIPDMTDQEFAAFRNNVLEMSKMLFARFEIMKFRSTPENDAAMAIDYAEIYAIELLNRGYLTSTFEGAE